MIGLVLFWCSFGLMVYTLFLFPIVILLRGRWCKKDYRVEDITPSLTVVVCAYNEEGYIGARIENLLASHYPMDQLHIIVGSDGSTDRTEEIVRSYADRGVQLIPGQRQGKISMLNDCLEQAKGALVVFTDANTHFKPDTLRELVKPFADEAVGGVAGNQIYTRDQEQSLTADGECAYWNFDRMMKLAQSGAGHITSATGAIYAIRRALFQPIPMGATDDFMVSTGVISQGARLVYRDEAQAFEPVAIKAQTEFLRKVRVITQGLYAVKCRRELLNPFRYGYYAFQITWHKLLRRLLVFPLLGMLFASPWIWTQGRIYQAVVLLQLAFYGAALLGFGLRKTRLGCNKLLTLPFYFCLVNGAALLAAFNMLRGRRIGVWITTRKADTV
ncbi:MAG: cellulose synthase/poly-beta-1,6-N-acetylglucosamine synthase-like glycosyltransferase [Kiritimatiellia bacterium]